jgi:hypothetical protein
MPHHRRAQSQAPSGQTPCRAPATVGAGGLA